MSIVGSGDLAYNNLSIPLVYNNNFLNIIIDEKELIKVGEMDGHFYNCDDPAINTKSLVRYEAAEDKYITTDMMWTPSRWSPITGYMCFRGINMNQTYRKRAFDLVNDNTNTHFYNQTKTVNSSGNISFQGLNPSVYLNGNGMLNFTYASVLFKTTNMNRVGNYTAQLGDNPPITGYTTATSATVDFLSGSNTNTWFSAQKMKVCITADNGKTGTPQTYTIDDKATFKPAPNLNFWSAEFYTYQ